MKVLIVHAHHEPKSFNGAMTRAACEALAEAGHETIVSDLHAMNFDPVSDRRNFVETREPAYLKQQVEERHASETGGFSPDILAELERLDWCDALIFQFPLWWFGLPAILKGWVDRVFVMGRVYGGGNWFDNGVFAGKRAMLSLTTGGGATMFGERGIYGDIHDILRPINRGIFRFTGFDVLPPFVVFAPARATDEERAQYLADYRARVQALWTTEPIHYPSLADFDRRFQLKDR